MTRRRWFVAAVATLAVAGVLGGAAAIRASDPAEQSASVPAAGSTATVSWTGTIPAGAHATSDCSTLGDEPTVDHHAIHLSVPKKGYTGITTTFSFQISWTPVTGVEQTNDEILTVSSKESDEGESSETHTVGTSDGSQTTETVAATNLSPGDYDVSACGFANVAPAGQPYQGTLTMTTVKQSATASLASADPQGLAFSASVAADPQRDEAEPLIVSDKSGLLYTCGPTGFSNASDYAQVSTDGGDQFHLMGTPPRGQQSDAGGGDCGLATAIAKNAQGNYQYAYTGLGALSGFATSTSSDNGHTLVPGGGDTSGGLTSKGALADRQWMTFLDDKTVLLTYNQHAPRNVVVLRSTDGGLTYSPLASIAAPNPDFPGPLRTIEKTGVVYMPWTSGESVNLAVSTDGGTTWGDCNVSRDASGHIGGGTAGFAVADNDADGNVYVVWSDKTDYHVWMAAVPAANLAGCNQPPGDPTDVTQGGGTVADTPDGIPTVSAHANAPVQVDRDAVRTTVFPWVAAGSAPGRVAVAFYGTAADGDPNTSEFKAAWNVYVNQSLNALASTATFSQVQGTTHPFHYDSICLNGLGCDISGGDRSLADFFAIAYNPADGRLSVVFDRGNKKPDEAAGHVATPMVFSQIAGPSNGGTTIAVPGRDALRSSTTDPAGDALVPYSSLLVTPVPANVPAGDFTSATVVPDSATGGFTVTLRVGDLSAAALSQALTQSKSASLVWAWRFTNGWQDAAAVAQWSPAGGFAYGFDDYTTDSGTCGGGGGKCEVYPGGTSITGSVNQLTGTITLTVPASLLHALGPNDQDGRPTQTAATSSSRFYDGTAFSFGNTSPIPSAQGWMTQLDNTPAFDFTPAGAQTKKGKGH
jgi:hypothetical protein